MAKCYMCGVELTATNSTEEHIILNAIGGVLKSKDLICKSCNSSFGNDMDCILAKQLQPFSVLMNVERDRGTTPPIKATRSSNGEGILVYPGGKPETIDPEIKFYTENGQQKYHIVARNTKEANKILKGIKKKYPSATVTNSGEITENINEKITIECDLGGGALESVCKTAIGYYLYSSNEQKHIQPFIDKFKERDIIDQCNFCYLNKPFLCKLEDGICHSIAIVGDSTQELLYAYIEFFNFYRVIVLFSDNYKEENFYNIYCYNLTTKCECKAELNMVITREMIIDTLTKDLNDYGQQMVRELQNTVNEIEVRNTIDKVCEKIYEKYRVQYPNAIPTDIFINAFVEEMANEYKPYMQNHSDRKIQECREINK